MASFNLIAPIYDRLVWVVFGMVLWKAQKHHLTKIKANDSVLILGGGTGKILKDVQSNAITFVDSSSKMIDLAQRNGKAEFVQMDYLKPELDQKFDWVICPFFLDCFKEQNLTLVLEKIKLNLHETGRLIVVDFLPQKGIRKFMIWIMILFFKLFSRLDASRLLDLRKYVSNAGFRPSDQASFPNGWVFSDIYSLVEK